MGNLDFGVSYAWLHAIVRVGQTLRVTPIKNNSNAKEPTLVF